MLRTMDTVHFCEQIKVSARQPHQIMKWRERDHINNPLTHSVGGSRNSGKRKTDKLQRQPRLSMSSSASHRLRILSSDQSHRKKQNIAITLNKHSSKTFEH
ncbi:hypothetical protein OGV94_12585 [Citrobacter sp. Ce006]|uniref:hypothetical protein n=1 Tax=Citrobacter TaxID=544 RepID=UPI001C8E1675|nr:MULTISPECIES: hypothetical protein [Citrobacter]MDM3319108.1 hypothetical protein [Citrobacter sp. Ce006]